MEVLFILLIFFFIAKISLFGLIKGTDVIYLLKHRAYNPIKFLYLFAEKEFYHLAKKKKGKKMEFCC